MGKKKIFTIILLSLIAITIIGTAISYFILNEEKPWIAFFILCCGGLLVVNFLVSLFLIRKNFK
jgi:hypothetical protein